MLTEAQVPGTDDWYLTQLGNQMGENFARIAMLDSYVDGSFVVPDNSDPATREAYMRFANRARLTFANTIVDQKVGRQNLRGFRTAAEDDINGDREAARIMRLNHFQAQFKDLQRAKYKHGEAYMVVGLDPEGEPYFRMYDQWDVGVMKDPLRPWLVDAALMIARDDVLELDILILMRDGYMRTAVKEAKESTIPRDGTTWTPGTEWEWVASSPFGFTERMPVIPFSNADSVGEFERHIDSLDRITEDILERLTITAMQAFRQRAMETGESGLPEYYPEDHPEFPGERIDYDKIYRAGPAALWLLPKGAKVWESTPIDMANLTTSEKKDLEHLAGITATPLYAFSPDVNGSAEGAMLQRETIRTRILESRTRDEESLAQFMSIAFEAYRDASRADPAEIYTMWGQIEYVSKAGVSEAARAARQAGKSQRFIDEFIYELTPEEMELEAQNLRDEQFQASMMEGAAGVTNSFGSGSARPAETLTSGDAATGSTGPVGELQPMG